MQLPPVGSDADHSSAVQRARVLLDEVQCLLQQAGAGDVRIDSSPWELAYDFSVPGNPVPKERPRFQSGVRKDGSRYTRTYTSRRTREAENSVLFALEKQEGFGRVRPDSQHRWRAEITSHMPDRRVCDVDNLAKTPLDALNGHVWKDDTAVTQISASKVLDRNEPRTRIRLYKAM